MLLYLFHNCVDLVDLGKAVIAKLGSSTCKACVLTLQPMTAVEATAVAQCQAPEDRYFAGVHVDDVLQGFEGSSDGPVQERSVAAGWQLVLLFRRMVLVISGKSEVLASSRKLRIKSGDLDHGYFQGGKLSKPLIFRQPDGGLPDPAAKSDDFMLCFVPIYGTRDAGRGFILGCGRRLRSLSGRFG